MSPFASRAGWVLVGVTLFVVYVGAKLAKQPEKVDLDGWLRDHVNLSYDRSVEELPPGQQFFSIPMTAETAPVKKGDRIDVLYQDESDTTPALIVEDVEIYSTPKGCRDPYPNAQLLLAKEEAERLGLLRDDGGSFIIRFTERKPEKEEKVPQQE
jgi:hypothetical protein